ncbi:MAG: hypothetical protein KatS3mg109_0670 [Pirellulaceae bacterium]|nr:MAG: hypothetical protein KatS3mg109_0670 [Pirellulaceae bacterium]
MVMGQELLTAALRYAELGYPVFPCAPGGKSPLTAHGFCDAVTDPEQIVNWWTKYPDANVGLSTENLVVIDVDGPTNAWPFDAERAQELLGTPLSLTPSGGRHYIFRRPADKPWKCSVGKLAPGVDVRTSGGYILVPPSTIGEKRYRWATELALDEPPENLRTPPAWLVEELDRLAAPLGKGTPSLAHVAAGGHGSNTIPQGQRNATLTRLAGTMRRVGMSQAEIAAALRQTNQDRCVPPLADREVERIAASIARYEPDAVAVALAENHFEQMFQDDLCGEALDELDPGPVPEELLYVPGFVDEVMQYTLRTAPYPERVLAFAGALVLQAFLAGRKVRDSMDNRTNLYVISLANSGVGKDHARKVNARILVEAGLADGLGTSFASGEGIEDRLYLQPVTLFQVDEIDGLLLKVSLAKDARHEQIVSILLQMYSAASTIYVMRAKAGRERTVIDQPCLCLFGTAVPKHFYESLSARLLSNGFLARFLILECRRRGTGRDDTQCPLPESIVSVARLWADFSPGGNLSTEHPEPKLVQHTTSAAKVFSDIRQQAEAEYDKAASRNDPAAMAIWARVYEQTRRLALIYACSQSPTDPFIDSDAAQWAGQFVAHQTRRMLYMASRYASESDFDAKRKRLLDTLEQWCSQQGDAWMPFWRINRRLPWSAREHEEIRQTLLAQQLIEVKSVATGRKGRPGLYYRLAVRRTDEETQG